MAQNQNKLTKKLKSYHLFLISLLLGSLLILNSNYVRDKKADDNTEKSPLFNKITKNRILEEEDNQDIIKVCKRGSEELTSYYITKDASKIDIDENEGIKCEDCKEKYMEALISIMRNVFSDEKKEERKGKSEKEKIEQIFDEEKDNIKKYLFRILPMLIFIIIAILSIIGWIVCGICACCDCCCCGCRKKESCEIPCFIFTYLFYAAAIIACIYGLSQTNTIFKGLADTECSVLRFLDQVVDGEIKKTAPRWIGINEINNLLDNLKGSLNRLTEQSVANLDNKINEINNNKNSFNSTMKDFGDIYYSEGKYHENYIKTFNLKSVTDYNNREYVLDIIKNLGHYNEYEKNYIPVNSTLYLWNLEHSSIANIADGYLSTTKENYETIVGQKSEDITKSLEKAQKTLNKLKDSFDDINGEVGDIIYEYSEKIDKYGKMGVEIVFSVLMLINLILAVFVLFICLCSAKCCASCCTCCRFLFKCFTHVLWNILALMMIVAFIIGSILAFVGRVGGDTMSLVSYVASNENFEDDNPLFLNKLGEEAKKYLNVCLHGDGNLENEFNIQDSIESINQIDNVLNGLNNITNEFERLISDLPAYKYIREYVKNRTELKTSYISLFPEDDDKPGIILEVFLKYLNQEIEEEGKNEKWSIQGEDLECNSESPSGEMMTFDLKKCKPINRPWISEKEGKIKDYATIISDIIDLTEKLSVNYFEKDLEELNQNYQIYLNSYKNMLVFLNETINDLIGEIRDKTGKNGIFSFLNGRFISINLKIVLKYLKDSLGKDFYKVGISLIIVGFSLILSISSTILLLVIINEGLKRKRTDVKGDSISYTNIPKPKNSPE